jgi:enoyl-CoA hydratase
MSYTTLLLDVRDGIATVTVNRPDKLNALNDTVIDELTLVADRIATDADIRGAILTGSGTKAFVAGADIAELSQCDMATARSLSMKGTRAFRHIEQCFKPVVAAVNGFALGGGCELAMACHLRLASENAKFGQPEVKLGTCPGYGGTVRLPRLVGRGRAIELLTSGAMINAQEAWRIGLVNRVVPADQLLAEAEKLACRWWTTRSTSPSTPPSRSNPGDSASLPAPTTSAREPPPSSPSAKRLSRATDPARRARISSGRPGLGRRKAGRSAAAIRPLFRLVFPRCGRVVSWPGASGI